MTVAWDVIAILFVATLLLKSAGPLATSRTDPSERARAVFGLMAPALLAGLTVYEAFGSLDGPGLVVDARSGALLAAIGALALRLPMLAVVTVAATTAALLRLVA
jgi:hypothetical protein